MNILTRLLRTAVAEPLDASKHALADLTRSMQSMSALLHASLSPRSDTHTKLLRLGTYLCLGFVLFVRVHEQSLHEQGSQTDVAGHTCYNAV